MYKNLFLIITFILIATGAHAEHGPYVSIDEIHKLNRGAINVITSPLEIPKRIKHQWNNSPDNPILKGTRVIGGTAEGVLFGLGRIGSGLWDIVTFNVKIPEDNEPLMKPDFVYQSMEDKIKGTGTHKLD